VEKEDQEKVSKAIHLAVKEGKPFDIQYNILTRDGQRLAINAVGNIKRDAMGRITKLFGTAQDVTARKIAEEAVQQSEKKYRYLFDSNPAPMWVMHRDSLRLLNVNQAALRHYGYTRQEFLSMSAIDIQSPEEKKQYHELSDQITAQPYNAGIWKHRRKDGTDIEVEIIFHHIDVNQQSACLVLLNDVTEKLKAERELKSSYQQLQELTGRLQNAIEDERTRIAREVHDELGQQLTALKMDASWIRKKVSDQENVHKKTTAMISLIDETVKTVRRISSELRPAILDDLGLIAALEWHGQEFEKRTGIRTAFSNTMGDFDPGGNLSTSIFRVYQEALTNVARHAHAQHVETSLSAGDGYLFMVITDDGTGFDIRDSTNRKSLGLVGMKERALMFKGELTIKTALKKGTVITLKVPLDKGEQRR
jgi:PAS domain S-box-containing protein